MFNSNSGFWDKARVWIIGSAVIFVGLAFALSLLPEPSDTTKSAAVFDVPSLVGKDIPMLIAALGTPDVDTSPTKDQMGLGTKKWEKTWKKNGYSLMATYEIESGKVVDLFLGADSDVAQKAFRETENIVSAGGLSRTTDEYALEFVKSLKSDGYTGVIVKQK